MKFDDYLQRAELISLQNFLKNGGKPVRKLLKKLIHSSLVIGESNYVWFKKGNFV